MDPPTRGPTFHPRQKVKKFQPKLHMGVKWNARRDRPPHLPDDFDPRKNEKETDSTKLGSQSHPPKESFGPLGQEWHTEARRHLEKIETYRHFFVCSPPGRTLVRAGRLCGPFSLAFWRGIQFSANFWIAASAAMTSIILFQQPPSVSSPKALERVPLGTSYL
jgi:hypothetical protein